MTAQKVILCIVDSFHPEALTRCLEKGSVPAFEFLIKSGFYHRDCVSVFPTMTPTASSSIATGLGVDRHRVPGFIWFNYPERRYINYGATPTAVFKIGPANVIHELLYNLNEKHLSGHVNTVFEILEENGISTASINFFIYRGRKEHPVHIPKFLRISTFNRVRAKRVLGPRELVIGSLCRPRLLAQGIGTEKEVLPWKKFGVNDGYSGWAASQLIRKGRQPDFMIVYFPDTDRYSHVHGPLESGPSIERVDRELQRILNSFRSWDEAMDKTVFIVAGDHSQTLIGRSKHNMINLPRILKKYRLLGMRERQVEERDLAICPNERMASVEILHRDPELLEEIAYLLARDERISQVMWKKRDEYIVMQGGSGKILSFRPGGPLRDAYGRRWKVEGNLDVIDASCRGEEIIYREYPDALERIRAALEVFPGRRILLSALPGYEFSGESAPLHPGGGSHGSLHKEDSTVPLIIAGSSEDLSNPRIVDFVPYILKHFGINNKV
ncbi:alkaline phosphatase family protein [Calderihabitans maritimus]|uniref:Phosphodiesterase n=1 Tax=Calderihabitans maritimus TaxID=1246530 RepID=A0A1Z5HXC4_9FIRM|nr:alkaline phosphatase family protein [Calderihabitans maritimus]GAW93930.1 phosphodiesterase [Calderihabitans maritimus]